MMKLREGKRREEMSLVSTGAVATSYRTRFEKHSPIQNRRNRECSIGQSSEDLIKQLLHSSFGFEYGIAMVHRSRQVSVRECNAAKRRIP